MAPRPFAGYLVSVSSAIETVPARVLKRAGRFPSSTVLAKFARPATVWFITHRFLQASCHGLKMFAWSVGEETRYRLLNKPIAVLVNTLCRSMCLLLSPFSSSVRPKWFLYRGRHFRGRPAYGGCCFRLFCGYHPTVRPSVQFADTLMF